MIRIITIVACVCFAGLIGLSVPLVRLFDAFQPLIVALSIMIAAIFVRLSRGMPTLEWSTLELSRRSQLTARIVELSREYVRIVSIYAFTLFVLVTITVVGKDDIRASWPTCMAQLTAAVIGAMIALNVIRMGYVIWRDYDIVKLQKVLIDASAARSEAEAETKSAADKISGIRSSGLKKTSLGDPKAWNE